MTIEELFAPGGPLAQADPRYELRPQQARMAAAVASALEGPAGLVVEAGTGVGKSMAYLLPAAVWAVGQGKRLLVSTHTRALQEQLLERELPTAARVMKSLGHTLRYAMLMGSDNYLCVQRLSRLSGDPGLFEEGAHRVLSELSAWARTAESGHRSSLPRLVPQGLWSRVSRDPDLCAGPNGPFWGSCLYRKDRERAERSHILVVNHALLLSGARLPPYDALVIDEAHTFEETAASHFGVAVPAGRFARLAEDARLLAGHLRAGGAESSTVDALASAASRLAEESASFLKEVAAAHGCVSLEEAGGRLLVPRPGAEPAALSELESRLLCVAEAAPSAEAELEARALHIRAGGLRADLRALFDEEAAVESARWVQWSPAGIELRAAPLDVAERLAQGLLSRGQPVVMTSATLSSGRGLREFKAHVGFEGARELCLDSPFDFESQAALLLQDDLPAPSDDAGYAKAVAARCRAIVARVPGGVFILFSSWKMLRRVHPLLKRKVKGRPLWVQGASGNDALLADFMAAGNAVLLGVDTFWQGVDVPGAALSCVVLVKLPFPNFGSPVEEARRRWFDSLGKAYFEEHSLPRAVMKFRQGFGRLIRSSSDRGAVVVLDPRVLNKGYGAAFLEALPRCRRLSSVEELGEFFGGGQNPVLT